MIISNKKQFTVTELNNSIKTIIEGSLNFVFVKGEVSQLKKHTSGHIYFTLKDKQESISAICWRFKASKLKYNLNDGDVVIIEGRITTYSPQSKYQLIVDKLEYEGEGSLLRKFEETKQKLLKAGLFDKNNKKKIPFLPNKVCLITSESGSVIKDMIHRIKDRFPIDILLFSVAVQGKNAIPQIKTAIETVNLEMSLKNKNFKIDVIILARGGGSLEDLTPFNSEEIVRSIFLSKIPVISAIGHDTDVTLCDFVSDLRAPTPTAAAEFLVPVRKELLIKVNEVSLQMTKSFLNNISLKKINLQNIFLKAPRIQELIEKQFQSLDFLENKLENVIQSFSKEQKIRLRNILNNFQPNLFKNKLSFCKERIGNSKLKLNNSIIVKVKLINQQLKNKLKLLNSLSYKNVLKRGYSVTKYNNKIIRHGSEAPDSEEMKIEFFESEIFVKKIKK